VKRRAGLILGALVLVAAVGAIGAWRWWQDRPPYEPAALRAHATLDIVDQATADAAMEPVNAEVADDGDQIFLGRVGWERPPQTPDGNSLRIVVLDKRSHLMPGLLAVTSATRPDQVGAGSDGALDAAEERYPWLRGAGSREIDGLSWTSGSALFVASLDASPVTFQFVLRPAGHGTRPENAVPTAPAAVEDLMIALISVGPQGQIYGAQRLLN
jgi:hypothetical protein